MAWDTIVIVQWDMLVFGRISDIFSELGENEILLSGVRRIEEVVSRWHWTRREQPHNYEQFVSFKEHIQAAHGPDTCLLASQFVVACFPRRFLELYSKIELPELGMIEYRVPTYAKSFGIPFCSSGRFKCYWPYLPGHERMPWIERVLIPTGPVLSLSLLVILYHLLRESGARVFHPFVYVFPIDSSAIFSFLFNKRRPTNAKKRIERIVKRLKRRLSSPA